MALPNSVEALINERTGKYFVVVDWDGDEDGKIKVINPVGDILNVPTIIFKVDDPKVIAQTDFAKLLAPEQIVSLERWEQERFSVEEKKRLQRAARASQTPNSRAPASTTRTRSSSTRKEGLIDKHSSSIGRRAMVQWTSDKIVFYRHKIEGLRPNDVFAIVIEGVGTMQMSKAEFQRTFNNIIMSPEYRNHGIFKYETVPDEARPFIIFLK